MKLFKPLTSLDMVQTFIYEHPMTLIYISRDDCSVCHSLLPQIERLMKDYPKIHTGKVQLEQVQDIVGHLLIFTVPSVILFVDGNEVIREARFVHLKSLKASIDRIVQFYEPNSRTTH